MHLPYKAVRDAYYFGILALAVYALPGISFVKDYAYKVLLWAPVSGFPLISIIALLVALGAIMGWKERRIG